jgi:hypothetical protein
MKVDNSTVETLVAALKATRDALDHAIDNHIYDYDNGDTPDADCQYCAALKQADAALAAVPREFSVLVRYRTNSGCNATTVKVMAAEASDAIRIASDKVRRRRGVIRIDGGECSHAR